MKDRVRKIAKGPKPIDEVVIHEGEYKVECKVYPVGGRKISFFRTPRSKQIYLEVSKEPDNRRIKYGSSIIFSYIATDIDARDKFIKGLLSEFKEKLVDKRLMDDSYPAEKLYTHCNQAVSQLLSKHF